LAQLRRQVMGRPHTKQGLLGKDALLPLKSLELALIVPEPRFVTICAAYALAAGCAESLPRCRQAGSGSNRCGPASRLALSQLRLTRLVIAHRPETVAGAQRVVQVKDGGVVELMRAVGVPTGNAPEPGLPPGALASA
jgi:hypothetical protein